MTTQAETDAATTAADERAREVEEQLTDQERFSLIISIFGHVPGSATGGRDPRIPEEVTNGDPSRPQRRRSAAARGYGWRAPAAR